METDKEYLKKIVDEEWTKSNPEDISMKAKRNCKKCSKNRWVDLWCYYCGSIYPQDNPLCS